MFQLAVKAWGEIIALVMEDTDAPDASLHLDMQFSVNPSTTVVQEDPLDTKWQDSSRESMLQCLQEKSRTTQWYRAAAEKLAISAKAIGMVQRHSHWKVRLALTSSCHVLLSRCCRFGSLFSYLNWHSTIQGELGTCCTFPSKVTSS